MQLNRLIYASKHNGTEVEILDRILQSSRSNNIRVGITGALIIGERHFLQLLEGERSAVAQCFMRIMSDNRHHDIQVMSSGDAKYRFFMERSMHRIETSRIKQEIMSYYCPGEFDPSRMSQVAVVDLCRTLSAGGWEALAA